jgi:hypothetical protein
VEVFEVSVVNPSKAFEILDSTYFKKIFSISFLYSSLDIDLSISPESDHSLRPIFINFISTSSSKL